MDFGVVLQTDPPAWRVVEYARQAELNGFSHVWTFDSHLLWQEPYVIYSQILAQTKRVMVGPMVTNPATRDWTVTASLFATLNEMFGNRTICGIGRGDSAVRVINGKPVTLAALRKSIGVIRGLAGGEQVEHRGSQFQFPWWSSSRLPVWVAAYGPKALALAGEVGDGFILQLADPDITAWSIAAVRKAAVDAGRDPSEVQICVAAPAYVTDGTAAEDAHARDECRWFGGMVGNHVADIVARYGANGAAVPKALTDYIAGRTGYDYNEHGRSGSAETAFVPDELIDRFCLIGPVSRQIERLQELESLGVDQYALYLQHDAKAETLAAYGDHVLPAVNIPKGSPQLTGAPRSTKGDSDAQLHGDPARGAAAAAGKGALLAAAVVATSMGVAACSSGSTGSGPSASQAGSGSGSSGAASGVGLSYVNGQLAKYGKLPKFTAPGPAFDAKKAMAGKTIFSIGVNNSDQFVQVLQNGMKKVAGQVGVKFSIFSNHGSPAEWVRGMQTAVNQKVDVIDLLAGIDPSQLHPQIAQAKKAGIPVVVSDAYDVAQKPDPSVTATADVPYAQAGRLMADWTISDTKGKADVLVIGSSDVVSSNFMVSAIQDEFSKHCSTCKVKKIDVTVANWASQTQSQVQSALNADPNINYILPVYDSQSQFIVPAITAAGKTGKVFIATYDGTPFVLKMMQDGNTVRMDVGEDLDWVSKAVMDQDMRVAAGLKPVKNTNTPLYIFTKKNVDTAGKPPKNSTGYGTAYIAGYKKLWGLS